MELSTTLCLYKRTLAPLSDLTELHITNLPLTSPFLMLNLVLTAHSLSYVQCDPMDALLPPTGGASHCLILTAWSFSPVLFFCMEVAVKAPDGHRHMHTHSSAPSLWIPSLFLVSLLVLLCSHSAQCLSLLLCEEMIMSPAVFLQSILCNKMSSFKWKGLSWQACCMLYSTRVIWPLQKAYIHTCFLESGRKLDCLELTTVHQVTVVPPLSSVPKKRGEKDWVLFWTLSVCDLQRVLELSVFKHLGLETALPSILSQELY